MPNPPIPDPQNNPPQTSPPQDNSFANDPLLQKLADLKKQKSAEENNLKLDDKNKEIEQLKTAFENAQKQIADLTEISKRALADLQNYRKRTEEEKTAFAKFANAGLILEIIPILDNFKRAFDHIPDDLKNNDWVKGIIAIEKQLLDLLQKQGLQEINALNKPFDANFHEALLNAPGPKDTVIEILEKGYTLGGKVLKPAKVKIGNGEQISHP